MNKPLIAGIQLTLVELVGDTSLKRYALTGESIFLYIGYVSYAGLVYILQHVLKTESLAITNGFWDALSNILTTVAGIAMGESLSFKQICGLLLISGGLFLL
jgi:multidrug transporter EmrE-like cation transporter